MGTAMGSSMAPSYESLFMGKLENDFLKASVLKPTLWLRFLDNIFMIWDHSLNELHSFIDNINNFHPCIKFTHTVSQRSVTFLDVKVSKEESLDICTDVLEKETNMHQYFDYTSCHPKKCKDENLRHMHKMYRPIVVFKCLRSLNDYLVSSCLKENNEDTHSPVISCCNRQVFSLCFYHHRK